MNWLERKIAENKAKEREQVLEDAVNVRIVNDKMMLTVMGILIDPSLFKDDVVTVVKQIREINK